MMQITAPDRPSEIRLDVTRREDKGAASQSTSCASVGGESRFLSARDWDFSVAFSPIRRSDERFKRTSPRRLRITMHASKQRNRAMLADASHDDDAPSYVNRHANRRAAAHRSFPMDDNKTASYVNDIRLRVLSE